MLMLFSVYVGLLVGFGGPGYLVQVIGMGWDGKAPRWKNCLLTF